ncbi:(2Fe-2S)-binding protein [Streptomyces sp. PTD5-9]|uniref:(2Fe-2S)-binding protein n=1 Tax=Streptomyces sp. PTD5-9 TaxID=3120150 RepID=UPI00300BB491
MYVCSCFGVTEQQVREHAEAGACTPRKIASVSKAGTDCGGCVRAIQAVLGRGACPRRELLDRKRTAGSGADAPGSAAPVPGAAPGAAPSADGDTPTAVPAAAPGVRFSEAA